MKFFTLLSLLSLLLISCDPEGKKNCAWVLEPEPDLVGKAEPGYIPVCARNRETMKQDCRLQATIKQAKAFQGRTFRYEDLRVSSPALPRTIVSVKFCDHR